MVAVRSRVFASDEELGKRDDDHKNRKMPNWNVKRKPTWRKRRIALGVLACIGVWLFIHYIPTDLGPIDRRTGMRLPSRFPRASPVPDSKQASDGSHGAPQSPLEKEPPASKPHDYDGPIRFYYLASTLRSGARARDEYPEDRDVLFAASNLNSAGAIIQMACEMSRWKRNTVHMALMGRGDLSIDEIQKINGAPKETCNIWWHDARPDFEATSTEDRMEVSVAGAMNHIISFIHPVVVITADMDSEDVFFVHGMQRKVKQSGITHIQVPKESQQSLAWAARLGPLSLKAWHSANIDVLVQAPLDSSGSLIRLLKSLAIADYSGFSPPRITIELPHAVDAATMNFLGRFQWPPARYSLPGQTEQLTIRRRIFEQKTSVDEAAHRFIESFYPSSSHGPHVLLLSPQTELSPVYFHYLKLAVLEYRHSSSVTEVERSLFGISLESPSVHLDGITPFQPLSLTSNLPSTVEGSAQYSPFRWQAPNTNAALYFGDKWMEVHSFLMKRHSATRKPSMQAHYQNEKKAVSEKSPAWAEYFLQLMISRSYFLHYPGVKLSSALAIVHNELYQLPEEFARMDDDTTPTAPPPSSESILTVKDDYLQSHHPSPSTAKSLNLEAPLVQNIEQMLSLQSSSLEESQKEDINAPGADPASSRPLSTSSHPAMPRLKDLPLLNHQGEGTTFQQLDEVAGFSRVAFRSSAGGCSTERSKEKEIIPLSAEDLFCLDDNEPESELPSQLFPKATQWFPEDNFNNLDDLENPISESDENEPVLIAPLDNEETQQKVAKSANPAAPDVIPIPPNAPIADAEKFQELARENMKKLEAAARIPGDTPPPIEPEAGGESRFEAKPVLGAEPAFGAGALPRPALVLETAPGVEPKPGDGPLPQTDPLPKPEPGNPGGAAGNTPSFPVLDASKLKAFDEGREAERDVPVPTGGDADSDGDDDDDDDDDGTAANVAKEP